MNSKRHAILIGCNNYDNLPELRCPINDVSEVESILKDQNVGSFDNLIRFSSGEANHHILPALEELITETAKPKDVVLIYYSGHGKLDRLGRLYLSLQATKETSLDATSIAIERLMSYVDLSRCGSILLVLDCCYSGAIKGTIRKGDSEGAFVAAAQGRGFHIMTSSTELQQSHEKEGDKTSIFTKFLVEGLKTGQADTNNDGWISADEAYTYTYNCVKGTGLQNPVKFNLDVEGDFLLARNAFYRPEQEFDPSIFQKEDREKFEAIKTMIDLLKADESPVFSIMLFKYYIEGEPYGTTALTVTPGHTPNIRQILTGFECDTFFPPDMLAPHARKNKEVVNGVVKVRMKVNSQDIMMIIGALNNGEGPKVQLYPKGKDVSFKILGG